MLLWLTLMLIRKKWQDFILDGMCHFKDFCLFQHGSQLSSRFSTLQGKELSNFTGRIE
jgi:hypothetical protein